MHFDLTPYIILPLLSAIMNAVLAGISLRERKVPAAHILFWLTLSISVWSLAFTVETASADLSVKIISRNIIATTNCTAVIAMLALALEVTGLKSIKSVRLLMLAGIIPLISVVLFWTNHYHHLQLYNYHLHQVGPLILLDFTKGAFFNIGHFSYNLSIYIISIIILSLGYARSPRSEWIRFTYLIIAGLIPLSVIVFKITPLNGFNFTSSTFLFTGILYYTAIFRYRLLDLVPIARETLIEIMADPVFVVDQSGQLALANRAARKMFVLPDKLAGISLADNLYPQLSEIMTNLSDLSEACIVKDGPEQRSWQIMKTRIDHEGRHQGWIITIKDITTILQANEILQTKSELLTMLSLTVEQSPVSIVITDLEGNIEFVNSKFTETTGYSREEAVGQNPRILKTEKTPPEVHKELWETIKSGKIWEGEFINRKKNGEYFTESAKIAPFKNRHGLITNYLAFKEDITARKQVEEELQRLNMSLLGRIDEETRRRMDQERLIANQARLVAMGEMIGAIAHQWRQPLSTLAMIVQRMHVVGCKKGFTSEELSEFKENAMRQIKYMSETIEEFSGFYNKDKQSELFSPLKCINDAVRLLETQFSVNNIVITINTHGNNDLLSPGYPNEFKQVILNLLGNARDAILESRISRGNHDQGRIAIDLFINEERKLIIDVCDNGCGIPDSIVNRIFDPYFTTKENSGGTGIGLYMSRMIMLESLGGFLKLKKADNGTVFRIKLPLGETS